MSIWGSLAIGSRGRPRSQLAWVSRSQACRSQRRRSRRPRSKVSKVGFALKTLLSSGALQQSEKNSLEAGLEAFGGSVSQAAGALEEVLQGPGSGALNNATVAAAKQIQLRATQLSRSRWRPSLSRFARREELSKLLV